MVMDGVVIVICCVMMSAFTTVVDSNWFINDILLGRPKHENFTFMQGRQSAALPSYLLLADSISKGMELGLSECHFQFRWERWDCTDRTILQIVHSGETQANRETAVVQALVTSGVMHVVSHSCTTGALMSCMCDTHPAGTSKTGESWEWKGCRHDGAKHGDRVSRALFDGVIDGTDARAAVSLHNNQVGREAIWRTLELRCKCHGVSGSCSMRTCWHRLPNFRRVGDFLKRCYARAVHANFQDGQLLHGNQARMRSLAMVSSKDLVYLVPSPDYCLPHQDLGKSRASPARPQENSPRHRARSAILRESPDSHRGVLGSAIIGTLGRECSRPPKTMKASKSEKRSCRHLCTDCGLKVKRYLVEVVSRCNCKFYWCCTVRCKECREVVEKYYCQR